jgi:hypothetical protein
MRSAFVRLRLGRSPPNCASVPFLGYDENDSISFLLPHEMIDSQQRGSLTGGVGWGAGRGGHVFDGVEEPFKVVPLLGPQAQRGQQVPLLHATQVLPPIPRQSNRPSPRGSELSTKPAPRFTHTKQNKNRNSQR